MVSLTIYSVVIFSHRYLDSNRINFKNFVFLAVYWSIWTSPYNTDIKVQDFFKWSLNNVKEELHNRFNLISEERVKLFKHNSENLMKIGWKIRKLWHFEVFANFQDTFLDQSIWICKWVRWWCHRLTISHSFCTQKWQKFHISAMRMLDLP